MNCCMKWSGCKIVGRRKLLDKVHYDCVMGKMWGNSLRHTEMLGIVT